MPEWMTAPEVASVVIRDEPRLPLIVLRELRLGVDAALSPISDADNGGWHGTSEVSAQRELFAPPAPATALVPEVTKQLLPLLERLLLEVMATETSMAEGSDEQDLA